MLSAASASVHITNDNTYNDNNNNSRSMGIMNRTSFKKIIDHSQEFKIKERSYGQQYANIYYNRLNLLKPILEDVAKMKWSKSPFNAVYSDRILDLSTGVLSFVIGTVYVDMPLKPNVLDEIGLEHHLIVPPPREKYISPDKDKFVLEDESGRIDLDGALLQTEGLVTGVVAAFLGHETVDGTFIVNQICYPTPPQKPFPGSATFSSSSTSSSNLEAMVDVGEDKDKWVAFVSGLNAGDASSFDMRFGLLLDYLSGELGTIADQTEISEISGLVIVGNALSKPKILETEKSDVKKISKSDYQQYDPEPLRILDTALFQLAENMAVHMMPGSNDPTNASLPQQPVHPSLFEKTSSLKNGNFISVPNPYSVELDGVPLICTSGQTIDDVYRYSRIEDRSTLAAKTLVWSHLAPTCPDTLWCYPFKDNDPFVMKELPHLYVIGNQPQFETKLIETENGSRIRIALIPSFAETGSLVLVNLRNLDVKQIQFNK